MSSKGKRTIYAESDCHALVDIITNFKDIVECKKTDAVTWKQKITAWEEITEAYNSLTTEPRTSDQLRCKFDNLKKDVRKYEAQKRQTMYKTGGGIDEADIKATLKLLYAKIKSIISLSVLGLKPSQGDSDIFTVDSQKAPVGLSQELSYFENNIAIEYIDISETSTSKVLQEVKKDLPKELDAVEPLKNHNLESKTIDKIKDKPQPLSSLEEKNDWSDYTPKKLQSKKHRVLQVKRKRNTDEMALNEDREKKADLVILKKMLLEEECAQNKKYNEERSRREEELHLFKIKNIKLQNEKLEMEILLLKKQLNN